MLRALAPTAASLARCGWLSSGGLRVNSFGRVCGGRRRRRRPATHVASAVVLRLELLVWRARAETQARDKQPWCGKATLELLAPPWPNGQGVGLLIRRLRVRVPPRVFLSRVQVCRRCGACALPGAPVAGAEVDLLDVSGVRKVRAVVVRRLLCCVFVCAPLPGSPLAPVCRGVRNYTWPGSNWRPSAC